MFLFYPSVWMLVSGYHPRSSTVVISVFSLALPINIFSTCYYVPATPFKKITLFQNALSGYSIYLPTFYFLLEYSPSSTRFSTRLVFLIASRLTTRLPEFLHLGVLVVSLSGAVGGPHAYSVVTLRPCPLWPSKVPVLPALLVTPLQGFPSQ